MSDHLKYPGNLSTTDMAGTLTVSGRPSIHEDDLQVCCLTIYDGRAATRQHGSGKLGLVSKAMYIIRPHLEAQRLDSDSESHFRARLGRPCSVSGRKRDVGVPAMSISRLVRDRALVMAL